MQASLARFFNGFVGLVVLNSRAKITSPTAADEASCFHLIASCLFMAVRAGNGVRDARLLIFHREFCFDTVVGEFEEFSALGFTIFGNGKDGLVGVESP